MKSLNAQRGIFRTLKNIFMIIILKLLFLEFEIQWNVYAKLIITVPLGLKPLILLYPISLQFKHMLIKFQTSLLMESFLRFHKSPLYD